MNNTYTDVFRGIVMVLGLFLLGGCVTATVQEVRERATGITLSDAVVVLGRRSRPSNNETEIDFISCVANNLDNNAINVLKEQEFVDATFPWFEPRTAPVSATELPALLDEPLLAQRLQQLGLRYVIWVQGQTKRVSQSGSMTWGWAGGGRCFGFHLGKRCPTKPAFGIPSNNEPPVETRRRRCYMPALVVPIPIIARVQNNACTGLANQLEGFILNQ